MIKQTILDGIGFLALLASIYIALLVLVDDSTANQALVVPTEITR